MFKRDLLKAKELLGPVLGVKGNRYWITAFEENCESAGEHLLLVRFVGGESKCFRRLSEVQAWIDDTALNNPILAAIAKLNLGIDSLKIQNSDSLDFHEVHVLALKKALRDAFEAGAASAEQTN